MKGYFLSVLCVVSSLFSLSGQAGLERGEKGESSHPPATALRPLSAETRQAIGLELSSDLGRTECESPVSQEPAGGSSSSAPQVSGKRNASSSLEKPLLTSLDVAELFIWMEHDPPHFKESGKKPGKSKLQKMLYYAQGYFLANTGHPLFEEDLYAKANGPVEHKVYSILKKYINPLLQTYFQDKPNPETKRFPNEVYQHLQTIYAMCFSFTDKKLLEQICEERPWKYAYHQDRRQKNRTNKIKKTLLRDFFRGPIYFSDYIGAAIKHSTINIETLQRSIKNIHNSFLYSSPEQVDAYASALEGLEHKLDEILEARPEFSSLFGLEI